MAVKRWNGSAWVVQAGSSAATNAATPNTIIQRDGSGGFSASGTVNLPANTIIGNVSATEIGYVDGVTSSIQSQFDIRKPVARLTSATGAIASAQAVVLSYNAPKDSIVAGDIFKFTGYATRAGVNSVTAVLRVRIGPTSLTGAIVCSTSILTSGTGVNVFQSFVTVRTDGASGTAGGVGQVQYSTSQIQPTFTTPVTIDTTIANVVEVTLASGNSGNTYTFEHAILEKLSA
jgi:hypothetical protein